jgi:hypothetical protein
MEEKICPMTGKPCGPHCGWFVPTHDKCAMILIGDSVFPLMMSVTGEYPDNPLARIAENTDLIGATLEDLHDTFKNTDFV